MTNQVDNMSEQAIFGVVSVPVIPRTELIQKSCHKTDVQSLLECRDGFDESVNALLRDIPLSTVENMSEDRKEAWEISITTWAQKFPSEDFFDRDPPSSEALIRDTLKPGAVSWTAFCKGDIDPDLDAIPVISQLYEPNPKDPLAIMGIRPSTMSTDPIFTLPAFFSEIVESFDMGNQQVLLTTKFWENDARLGMEGHLVYRLA